MVELRDFLLYSYPTAEPFAGVSSVSDNLKGKHYLVVADDENPCYGILTSEDLLEHPHKLVIDCMTKKESIQLDDSSDIVKLKFKQSHTEALPVYDKDLFLGILEKTQILIKFKNIIDDFQIKSSACPELKTSLLHNLYHEIRTPLSHVLGFMDVLSEMDEEDSSLNIKKYREIIQTGSRQFLHFMNELVDLSLIESGENLSLTPDVIDPKDVLIELVAQHETNMDKESKIYIRRDESDFSGTIVSDYKRLKQVLSHLINITICNSITFNSILIGCDSTPEQEQVRFYVKNETAIISEKQSTIMMDGDQESFSHDEIGQYGFGVEVVKKITELIKGSFCLEIDDNGKIAAYLTLPLTI
jgi:light-regulated signal transduction histidine kinase (bacteriophytochrome)